ncbi:MAG: hypothetical protein ACI4JT_10070, partial [Oscillospiraceae bacterium]
LKNAGKFSDIESENLLGLASCFFLGTHFDIYALSGIFGGVEPPKMRDFEKLVPRFSKSRSNLYVYHRGEVVLVSCDFSGVKPEKLARVAELMLSFSVKIDL